MTLIQMIIVSALTSASICGLLVAASRDFPRLAGRSEDLSAIQRTHGRLTPRVGGLGIFAALVMGFFVSGSSGDLNLLILLFGPVLLTVVSLAEDLGFRIKPWGRLAATFLASLLVGAFSGVWLTDLGLGALDLHLTHFWLTIPITLIVTAALAQGFNLIDGVNGLSSGVGLLSALGLSFIANSVGEYEISAAALILAAGIAAFLAFNFPFGWIFLGDTGAYLIGFTLAWLGITLIESGIEVTAWSMVLIMFWPLADVLFSFLRRIISRRNPFVPDRLHMHSIVNRGLKLLGRSSPLIQRWHNPLTTVVMFPLYGTPVLLGLLLYDDEVLAFIAACVCTLSYLFLLFGTRILYRSACRWLSSLRKRSRSTINAGEN